ncbi:hypothetical protein [Stutzerimonas stutzeri]|jgi:hypothetical protein|uniref:Uncharacterized protein n=1 Tax=Stutzerimonas stutzeri TaxID=316 RepID=A0A5S5B563_STUST|nr:hypothetical protein [Stutzerimonas stutzeri]TYP62059.1 hypothetical protein A9A72_124811 [Stutzerimonas stutzeri]
MSGPYVRPGQGGNTLLTSPANHRFNQLHGRAGRLGVAALPSQYQLNTPLVIWNLQVL